MNSLTKKTPSRRRPAALKARAQARKAWDHRIFLLPNLFTTANMFCGFLSMILSSQGKFVQAAWIIPLAILFDSMDGRLARLTRTTSQFGVEYDSLSDLISFGMAPAFLSYSWALSEFGRLGWLAAFFYLVCVALRLARFNIMVGTVPKGVFQGIPSPLAACWLASSVHFYRELELSFDRYLIVLPVLLIASSLMVSTIPFPSFKDTKLGDESSSRVLAMFVLVLILMAIRPEITLFIMPALYIVAGIVLFLVKSFKTTSPQQQNLQQGGIGSSSVNSDPNQLSSS